MNREMMLRVADAVERENANGVQVSLDMFNWHDKKKLFGFITCGTTACIGGFVDILLEEDRDMARWVSRGFGMLGYVGEGRSIFARAKEALDLNYEEADQLMLDRPAFKHINKNRKYVPDALRWMALTERVDWYEAIRIARCVSEVRG